MSGGGHWKLRGIIPRAINQIFNEIACKAESISVVRVSFVEVYNELLYDLLSSTVPSEQTGSELAIQED
eukprot:CAMPEP_0201284548 /NCGR_PEP_ID=MMETSP1317-20130820/77533_1 /ASSEMBLY_ACC=CAM_ASM_000770 /TAXON_ID=187299 /ORGANISM="Undescribed Undescribed, Strain Undescribed" /LENGTH=68 /DNA_ID=CAMNT_0047605155 /DNA_START=82 /DNA_END=285 /DNA_ORIENTATION=+